MHYNVRIHWMCCILNPHNCCEGTLLITLYLSFSLFPSSSLPQRSTHLFHPIIVDSSLLTLVSLIAFSLS